MAIYAFGDIQGCYDELAQLLEVIHADPAHDEFWFVGDLVNRGPNSLEVLRLVQSLGRAAVVTLGNHDLHLLAHAYDASPRSGDEELRPVLEAHDRIALLKWLRQQPLAHYQPDVNTLMVHAGVARDWNPLQTVKLAREVEHMLRGPDCAEFLAAMYGDQPDTWSPDLHGMDRLRFIVNCLTRIRYCQSDGRLDFRDYGPPGTQAAGLVPWFDLPERATASVRLVFGHWSSLGLLQHGNLLGLDTGCVWGRSLTAVRLDGPARTYSVACQRYRPGGE